MKYFSFLSAICVAGTLHAQTVTLVSPIPSVNFDPIAITTVAGTGEAGFSDGLNTVATFNSPRGIAVDGNQIIYVADAQNNRIRKITPAGLVTTFAGSGVAGFANGTGTAAQFCNPIALATDIAGNVYVADGCNNAVRKITPAGVVTTLAGNALTGTPGGVTVDAAGNVYVSDLYNYVIRKITPVGVVTIFAGSGTPGGADGQGGAAQFIDPQNLTMDAQGNIYVQQVYGPLRKISPTGLVSTPATTGGFFGFKIGVAADNPGNLYVSVQEADATANSVIYKLFPNGNHLAVAGGAPGYQDATGAAAKFNYPIGMAMDDSGNVYLADVNNNRIRKMGKPKLNFNTTAGTASSAGYFSISANYLSGNASLAAPPGYELALAESGPYSNTLSIPSSAGEIQMARVYLRLGASDIAGTYNEAVTLSANGAVLQKLRVTGIVSAKPGTGLQGVYYNGINLSGSPLLTRIDSSINFDLSYGNTPQILSPAPGIVPEDMYSVRWTGQVQAKYSETYTFYTTSDDGIRLWVNGVQLVDDWVNQSATEKSASVALIAGQKYDIKIEYYENTGNAVTKLSWSSPGTPKAIIPQSQLYPPDSITPPPIPACVTNISPSNATAVASQTTATLTWNTAATATSYDVYVWSGATIPTIPTANVALTTYSATGLVAGTLYNWFVAPKNASGTATTCATTNKTTFTTATGNQPATSNAGSNATITLPTSSVTLDGSASTGNIVQYYWYQPQGPAQSVIGNNFSSVTTATGLTTAGTYIFGLQVKDNLGVLSYAYKTVTVKAAGTRIMDASTQTIPASPSTLNAEQNSSLPSVTAVISPNPVVTGKQAKLQINSSKAGTVMVNIVSSNGAIIATQRVNLVAGINKIALKTAGLAQGFHIIHIAGANKPLNVKLVIQ